jgi:hypothetical protein
MQPYLSIVMVGRNDNYGGDFRLRLQRCMSNTFERLNELPIHSEIIFVNYNPLDAEKPIEEFIDWPSSNRKVGIRIITVPKDVHQQLVQDGTRKDVPVMEYLGKNAGIRRAKGKFILSMNPDIILPIEVVKHLQKLKKDGYYRTDRVDFSGDIFNEHQFIRVFLKGHDFIISSLNQIPKLRMRNYFLNKWRNLTPKISWLLNMISVPVYYNNFGNRYHCNVSGDFMLMHRDHWFALEAHNENRPIALHVDSLMVIQAAALGLREFVLKQPIFHQEHSRRFDATQENPEYLQAFEFFTSEARKMMKNGVVEKYNGQQWGLSKFDLPELNL